MECGGSTPPFHISTSSQSDHGRSPTAKRALVRNHLFTSRNTGVSSRNNLFASRGTDGSGGDNLVAGRDAHQRGAGYAGKAQVRRLRPWPQIPETSKSPECASGKAAPRRRRPTTSP